MPLPGLNQPHIMVSCSREPTQGAALHPCASPSQVQLPGQAGVLPASAIQP